MSVSIGAILNNPLALLPLTVVVGSVQARGTHTRIEFSLGLFFLTRPPLVFLSPPQPAETFSLVCTQSCNSTSGTTVATRVSCGVALTDSEGNQNLACPLAIPAGVACPYLAFVPTAADVTVVSISYSVCVPPPPPPSPQPPPPPGPPPPPPPLPSPPAPTSPPPPAVASPPPPAVASPPPPASPAAPPPPSSSPSPAPASPALPPPPSSSPSPSPTPPSPMAPPPMPMSPLSPLSPLSQSPALPGSPLSPAHRWCRCRPARRRRPAAWR